MKKHLACVLIILLFVGTVSFPVAGAQTITNATVRLDYTKLTIEGFPSEGETLLYNDTLYIPISIAAKELGFSSVWDEKTNTTNITPPKTVKINVQPQKPKEGSPRELKNATVHLDYTKLTINGKASASQTLLYNDTLYVPISNAAQELGFNSVWDANTNTTNITISGQARTAPNPQPKNDDKNRQPKPAPKTEPNQKPDNRTPDRSANDMTDKEKDALSAYFKDLRQSVEEIETHKLLLARELRIGNMTGIKKYAAELKAIALEAQKIKLPNVQVTGLPTVHAYFMTSMSALVDACDSLEAYANSGYDVYLQEAMDSLTIYNDSTDRVIDSLNAFD